MPRNASRTREDRSSRSEDGEQEEKDVSNVDKDVMGLTTSGRPPRVSRRRRSEYAPSWQRGPSHPRTGKTGSRHRSTSRHWMRYMSVYLVIFLDWVTEVFIVAHLPLYLHLQAWHDSPKAVKLLRLENWTTMKIYRQKSDPVKHPDDIVNSPIII